MLYNQVIDYLYEQLPMFHRVGAAAYKADLNNTLQLCRLLGNPERKFKSIHVAGTNGKGSTCHALAAILQTAGYKTGLYTSPHLVDFRERIRINGKMIPKQNVTDFVNNYRNKVENIQPSFFEWTVALCFDYFAKEKVDIAVIETGLGGRLDSTNVITPMLSIITNIGLDHTDLLGNTLEKIAIEKAGIIKSGVPVIISQYQKSISCVFERRAKESKSKIIFAKKKQDFQSDLTGLYQKKNFPAVLEAVELLRKQGFKIKDEDVEYGLSHIGQLTGLRGRWEKLSEHPLTYADVGHNKDGIKEVLKMISRAPHKKLHAVIGFVKDKDISAVLKLLPKDAKYYFCKADLPRALDEKELLKAAQKHQLKGNSYSSVKMALMAAKKASGKNDLIFIGGSTFVVAEAIS